MKIFYKFKYRILSSLALVALNYGVWLDIWARQEELSPGSERMAYSLQAALVIGLLIDIIILFQVWGERWLLPLRKIRRQLGWWAWPAVLLVGVIPCWFYYFSPLSVNLRGPYIRLIIYLFFLGLMAWLAAKQDEKSFEWNGMLASIILFGSLFALGSVFREVSTLPFGVYWSEGNRFYDYSIMFGRDLYQYEAGKPLIAYIDPARQSLWGFIFLLPKVSIWGMRFWNGIIFSLPYILLGWLCLKRRREDQGGWALFGLWAFLFLNQGPIYTPLVLAAILVASTRRLPLLPGFLVMIAAGFYARMGRITWMFAPAMWAVTIALVESNPVDVTGLKTFFAALTGRVKLKNKVGKENQRSWVQGWRRAFVLGAGGLLGGYYLSVLLPQIQDILPAGGVELSVQGITQVVGLQPLLWDRLLPNTTYPPGILFGLFLAVGPLIALLVLWMVRGPWKLDIWQKLVLGLTAAAFSGVGVVVSIKIGGGSNLHNLDMLFIALLFAAALAWEKGAYRWLMGQQQPWGIYFLLLAALAIPASQGMMQAASMINPPQSRISEVLSDIRLAVADAKTKGDVLFIDQRQLLTFGYIQDIPLIPEYEKKLMMDRAMTGSKTNFQPFYQDLADHRFSLIISEPLMTFYQTNKTGFNSENNAWVTWVSVPILCYYKPVATYSDIGVQLLVPKEKNAPTVWLTCP